MNDEFDESIPPDEIATVHPTATKSGKSKVYERPGRPPMPLWGWIIMLLALMAIVWFVLQFLQ